MTNASRSETWGEKRHRLMNGRGLCHAHAIIRSEPVCGKRSGHDVGGFRLCVMHAEFVLGQLTPQGHEIVESLRYDQIRREAAAYRERLSNEEPLRLEIAELRAEVNRLNAMTPRERRREKREAEVGTVYFIRSNGFVKIGWTSDLDSRLKQYDPDARVLATKPGTRADERFLHKKFDHLRTHRREWFAMAPQVMEEIQRTVREHGEPPRDINEPVSVHRIVGPRLDNYIGGRSKSA